MPTTGPTIVLHRGDTFVYTFSDLEDLTDRLKLFFSVKPRDDPSDSSAVLQLMEYNGTGTVAGTGTGGGIVVGLLVVESADPEEAANGVMEVLQDNPGSVQVTVKPEETAKLVPAVRHEYDIQMISKEGVVTTLLSGQFRITRDTTRTVS